MRQFVVVGHGVPTDPAAISLDDLPGAGRLDVLCRCVNAAFFLSHAIREDVRCRLVLADSYTVRFEGAELRHLHPDERSTAARVRAALDATGDAIGHVPANPSPGVYLSRTGFAETIAVAADEGTVVELHEDGDPLVDADPPTDPVFVLSDHGDFTDDEAALLREHAEGRVRVGPEVLHADHAMTVVHNWLDTDGYTTY